MRIVAFFLLVAGFFLSHTEKIRQKKRGTTIQKTYVLDALQVLCVVCGLFVAISFSPKAAGIWSKLLAGSGIAAVIIGLAAQSAFANVFCGMMLLFSKPYAIGDRIEIGDDIGFVTELTLQYTIIRTYLNEIVMIPNSVVSSSRVKNYSCVAGASYPIEIQVAYGTDLKEAKKIIVETVTEHPLFSSVLGTPVVLVKEAGDFGIILKVVVTTTRPEDNALACSECLEKIIERFSDEDIEIPYPTHVIRNICLKNVEESTSRTS